MIDNHFRNTNKISFLISIINDKPDKFCSIDRFKNWLKYRKVIKKLKVLSPSFDDLIEIYKFLSILNICFMYTSELDMHKLYAEKAKGSSKFNEFIMYNGIGFSYSIGLNNKEKVIGITINRVNGDNTSYIQFEDGKAAIDNMNDEILFINIINTIMDEVVYLFKYYYRYKYTAIRRYKKHD